MKSGADFPAYIKEIKNLGVTHYEAYVEDDHIDYHGEHIYTAKSSAKYDPIVVADIINREKFIAGLKAHQLSKTDFLSFIQMCATIDVEKWKICMEKMTCTYYDKEGKEVIF